MRTYSLTASDTGIRFTLASSLSCANCFWRFWTWLIGIMILDTDHFHIQKKSVVEDKTVNENSTQSCLVPVFDGQILRMCRSAK